ncbi:site-specific recombinase [Bdellovibrio sp. KM01]|uniref:site-specific recombinase n=1 Tax=Bdellovibrio sp. KM01 TaxID=2748865 RepID=UPI0015EA5AAE|nr:site-specific recombinase [Bdellovibrio sp. KM01]QLY24060.1 site-specific recombinase [Bdellovibrio sp. KM01]
MFDQLRKYFHRFKLHRQRSNVHSDLDALLSFASDQKNLEDQLHWLVNLLRWVRYEGTAVEGLDNSSGHVPIARLRYVLMVLDRNPAWKRDVAVILRSVIKNVSGLELYTETGLPHEVGVIGEFFDRMMMKILPSPPLDHELGYLFWELFPSAKDPMWIASIDHVLFDKLVELFNYDVSPVESDWNRLDRDMEDALIYLGIQVRAIGLSPGIRHRLDKPNFRDSAFFNLVRVLEDFLAAHQTGKPELFYEKASRLRLLVWECRRELTQVYRHLDEFGVSVNLVFQMTRLRIYLQRIDSLVDILITDVPDAKKVTSFLANLIEENHDLQSVGALLSQNINLLAKKMVERAAETGEHYITRTKEEYRRMVQAAAGGGFVTAFTVYIKTGILAVGPSEFMIGVLASTNYAISFIVIHLAGFTLGTKQPAMTAPALAEQMRDVDTEEGMERMVDQIAHIIRSQVAAVGGNILMVVPTTLVIDTIYFLVSGRHIMSEATAMKAFTSVDILGPAIFYAAFTGIILWFSSLFAGWGDNWFALNSLRTTLARSPTLTTIFGRVGARRIASFFEKNISGLLGNASLGILLGFTPEIMRFIGIPLDVRHVTLSSGSMGAALPVMGASFLKTWIFWRAVMGVLCIGFFNVSVSFAMAFWVAIKARGVTPPTRRAIRKAVFRRLLNHPLSFILPVGKTVPKSAPGGHSH